MGLLFLDSFDDRYFANGASYASYHTKWDVVSEDSSSSYANSISQVDGRTGKACKLGGTSYLKKTGYTIPTTLSFGFALKVTSAPASETTIISVTVTDGGINRTYNYKLTTDLKIKLYSYNDTTEYLISNTSFSTDTWIYVESNFGTGSASLYKDGATWLAGGAETAAIPVALLEPDIKDIKFSGGIIIDDLYLYEGSIYLSSGSGINNCIKVKALVPTSNGTADTNAWQSVSYLDVDECYQANHDSNSTYDESNATSPSRVSYNFADQSNYTIKGVQTSSWVARYWNGLGSASNVDMVAITRVSSSYYESNTVSAGATYSILLGLWENNPNTSTAWTTTTFNSAEFGVKALPVTNNTGRLTAITVELAYIPNAAEGTSYVTETDIEVIQEPVYPYPIVRSTETDIEVLQEPVYPYPIVRSTETDIEVLQEPVYPYPIVRITDVEIEIIVIPGQSRIFIIS